MAERAFWNPMTNVGAFRERGITIVRGEGSTVWDDAGNALLDVSAALWYCNVGYGRGGARRGRRRRRCGELASYKTYDGFTSPPTEELATRVAELVPLDGAKIFFTSGGGESIDTAAKLARAYWAAVGKPDKHVDHLAAVRLPRLERVRHRPWAGWRRSSTSTGGSSPRSSRSRGTTPRRSRRRSTGSAPSTSRRSSRSRSSAPAA